jgi:superfamily II DNA or RNA helicase
VGATFSLVLEEKTALGLAAPPPEQVPLECLGEEELVRLALEQRQERARTEKMRIRSTNPESPWTDYTVTNPESGKTYRVALRGEQPGESYCSCPDFRTNTLGVCKHLLHVLDKVRRRFPAAQRQRPFKRRNIEVYLAYGHDAELRLGLPDKVDPAVARLVRPFCDQPIRDTRALLKVISRLEAAGHPVTVFPDAGEFIQERLFQARMTQLVDEIRRNPAKHPFREELLNTKLLPYQLDGVAFAVGAGRAVLADDMGLGKTIQGIGVAELLAREADIKKVLIVCPASLKSQWRAEIQRFCDRQCQLVLGGAAARFGQYDNEAFFTICNYEQVLRDILAIEQVRWDLIVLDEAQRIKNWEAKTSRVIKGIKSPFALALTGTPLENRLDELYSVVEFIDDRRLAPAFRFFNRHRVVDENGKVLGYRNLAELREKLKPVLLRRTRDGVMRQLPPRTTEIVRIPPTDEQMQLHEANMQTVATIVAKKFLTEMDLLRLQKALLMCRMAADSTFLVDKHPPGYSTKLDRLAELFDELFREENRKVVLFSEWTTMLNLIEERLDGRDVQYVRLDGSVPQKKRQQLVHRFQEDDNCRLFLTTNAGSVGLNLQAANTVINVDLPWNPAILEQRIGRAHRMGQKRPVQVFVLVTEDTLEENLLGTLSAKHELALAALDVGSEVDEVDLQSGMEELKRRLEVLLGAKPEAATDESELVAKQQEAEQFARRERVAAAGGELLGAAFSFLGELVSDSVAAQPSPEVTERLRGRLAECVQQDESGTQRLTVTLPDSGTLDRLAQTLARLLVVSGQEGTP